MILTTLYRSINAVGFQENYTGNIWAILGQYSSWSGSYSDTNPPPPSPSDTSINQAFCAIPADLVLVLPTGTSSGQYSFLNVSNEVVYFNADNSPSDFITNGGTLVMVSATTLANNILALESSFRWVGFATGLVATSGHQSDLFLPASNVSSWGNLIMEDKRVPATLVSGGSYTVSGLFQF